MNKLKFILLVLFVLITGASCSRFETEDDALSSERTTWTIGGEIQQASCGLSSQQWTKTYLSDDDAEKIYGATIGIYYGGKLLLTYHQNGTFEGYPISGELMSGEIYSYYMVSGPMAQEHDGNSPILEFPEDEADVADLEFFNTAGMAATMEAYGLDRCGCILNMSPEDADASDGTSDGKIQIPLTPLWAKVVVSFDFSEIDASSFKFQSTGTYNCNKRLRPFDSAGSKATSSSDVEKGLGDTSDTFTEAQLAGTEPMVFYLPENMQGDVLPSNTNPYLKAQDNPAITYAQRSILSYIGIAFNFIDSHGIVGITNSYYRIYPGADNVTNFDIERNGQYNITLKPTLSGLFIDCWKSEGTYHDTRGLKINGVTKLYSEVDKDYLIRMTLSSSTLLNPIDDAYCYAIVFNNGGNYQGPQYAYDSYGADKYGWVLSDESQALLEKYGIEWDLALRKAYYCTKDGVTYFFSDEEAKAFKYSSYLKECTYGNYEYYAMIKFTYTGSADAGTLIPITIESSDKGMTSTMSLYITSAGNISVSLQKSGNYVAQQNTIDVDVKPDDVDSVRYTVVKGSDVLTLKKRTSATAYTVQFLKAGEATLKVEYRIAGNWITSSEKPVITVINPVLKFDQSSISLNIDGTTSYFNARYYTTDGTIMNKASSDDNGYGNYFAPSLYNSLLTPVYSITSPMDNYITLSGNGMSVTSFTSSSGTKIDSYFDKNMVLTAKAKGLSDITATTNYKIASPFENKARAGVIIGYIDNTILLETDEREEYRKEYKAFKVNANSVHVGETIPWDIPGTVSPSNITLSCSTPDLSFSVTSGRKILVSRVSGATKYSAGKYNITATISNGSAGNYTTVLGAVEVFLHGRFLADVSENATVFTTIQTKFNNSTISGFTSLYNKICDADMLYAVVPSGWVRINDQVYCNPSTAHSDDFSVYYTRAQRDFEIAGTIFNPLTLHSRMDHFGMAIYRIIVRTGEQAEWRVMKSKDSSLTDYDCFFSYHQPRIALDPKEMDAISGIGHITVGNNKLYYTTTDDQSSLGTSYYVLQIPSTVGTLIRCYWNEVDITGVCSH